MLSKRLNRVLAAAFQEATERSHEYLTVDHLLYSLLDDSLVRTVLQACDADLPLLKSQLRRHLSNMETLSAEAHEEPVQTIAFQRVIQKMVMHMQSAGKAQAETTDLLAAMFAETRSMGIYFLRSQGIERLDVLEVISHHLGIPEQDGGEVGPDIDDLKVDSLFDADEPGAEAQQVSGEASGGQRMLDQHATELVQLAREGGLDPLIGRTAELRRLMQVLCRRKKNNPVLVGEPGVGKTAVIEGLASRIARSEVPDELASARIYAIELSSLLADTKYRGDFEKRLKGVIAELEQESGAIVFIDEIHQLVGAGATSGGSMDASNILKPALASGKLRCIGATTYEEYRNHFRKDSALNRRFQQIDVPEPSVDETRRILAGLRETYEQHHRIRFPQSALDSAAELAKRYMTERFLPDSAIDLVDEIGASFKLLPPSKRRKTVTVADVERTVASMARLPERRARTSERERLRLLPEHLRRAVFGQDQAIDQLCRAVRRSRAGLASPRKPMGSFLFTGPTGVGKTEVARQLAGALDIHFSRFDMSEYMEKHAVARLIGSPPGYVGFEQGGLLTETIRKHPHSVLLLDEIEKAHPDLQGILLQVMDNASLTDNTGAQADFRNVIIIMTSNCGAAEAAPVGFSSDLTPASEQAVERFFSPEFRNRLDMILAFAPLQPQVMELIVDKFMRELEDSLRERAVEIQLDAAARADLAQRGYDPRYGARPLAGLIDREIKDKLAEEMLFGQLQNGGTARVWLDTEGEIALECLDT